MFIDIVILPPLGVRNKIGKKVKKEIDHFPNFFVVDNINLIPHLSLWHMKVSEGKISNIAKELKKITKGQEPIKVSSLNGPIVELKGSLEFLIASNKNLILFQQKVFQKIFSCKNGAMPKFPKFVSSYSKGQLKEVEKYGRCLEFNPHFTMGWLKNKEDVIDVKKRISKIKFSFLAKEIYICEVNEWWQVKGIIKKIDFK